jgi:beta-aspartyl-dipeptidase (metallo-type)
MIELLTNGEIYGPAPQGIQNLLIAGERVVWMGPELPDLPQSLGTIVTDLAGKRVIPGLIDCHVHLTGGGGEDGFASRVDPLSSLALLAGGTTSVVGVLGTDDTTRNTASLVAATRKLNEEGVNGYCMTGGYHLPLVTLTGSIRGDLVHVDPIIGAGEIALSDHRSSQPTLDELLRVASEVHVGGMLARKAGVVHLHIGDGGRGLALIHEALDKSELPARVFHPTHVNRKSALFDAALALTRRGCAVDVTAFPEEIEGDEISASAAIMKFLNSDLPPHLLTVSSDSGGSLPCFDSEGSVKGFDVQDPGALGALLSKLVAAGVPLHEALPPFTSNPARLLKLQGKGMLNAGCSADLVVMDSMCRAESVMSRGAWKIKNGLPVAGFKSTDLHGELTQG